jgi:hypothetical protein
MLSVTNKPFKLSVVMMNIVKPLKHLPVAAWIVTFYKCNLTHCGIYSLGHGTKMNDTIAHKNTESITPQIEHALTRITTFARF